MRDSNRGRQQPEIRPAVTHPLAAVCLAHGLDTPAKIEAAAAAPRERDELKAKLVGKLRASAKTAALRSTGSSMASIVDALTEVPALEAFIADMNGRPVRSGSNGKGA